MNLPKQHMESMKLVGLYTVASNIAEKDPEYPKIRAGGALKGDVRPNKSQQFLVVRVMFDKGAADTDFIVRFSPGSCRLLMPKRGEEGEYVDMYPVGTLSSDAQTLFLDKLDDFLFVNVKDAPKGADLVFVVDNSTFEKGAPDGTFFEFKRLARVDLSGQKIKGRAKADENIDVMRKPLVLDPNWTPNQTPNPPPPPPPQPQPSQPAASTEQPAPAATKPSFQYVSAAVSADLPVPITAPAGASGFTKVDGGTGAFKEGKADALDVTRAAGGQAQGTPVTQVDVPDGSVMVKVSGSPAAGAASPWQCVTECDQIQLVDSTGKKYQPNGVYATYTGGTAQKFMMQYNKNSLSGAPQPPDASGGPKDVILMYIVPQGITLNELDDHQQKIQQLSLTATK